MKDCNDPGTLDLENHIKSISPKEPYEIDTSVFKSLSKDDKESAQRTVDIICDCYDHEEGFEDFDVKEHPLWGVVKNAKYNLPNSLTDITDKPDLTHKIFMMLLLMADENGFVLNAKERLEKNLPYSWQHRDVLKREMTLKKHMVRTQRLLSAIPVSENEHQEALNSFCEWIIISEFKRKVRDPLIRNISVSTSILERQGYLVRRYFNIQKDEATRGHPNASGYWKDDKKDFRLFRNGTLDVFLTHKALEYRSILQCQDYHHTSMVSEATETVNQWRAA